MSAHFFLDQNFSQLKSELSVLDNLAKFNPKISSTEWRNQLGQLRIRGDKSELPIQCLSGGERLKVALLGLSFYAENIELLLLDEPENHLDIESRELLANAIKTIQVLSFWFRMMLNLFRLVEFKTMLKLKIQKNSSYAILHETRKE